MKKLKMIITVVLMISSIGTANALAIGQIRNFGRGLDETLITNTWSKLINVRQSRMNTISSQFSAGQSELTEFIQLKKEVRLLNDCIMLKTEECNYEN